MRECVFLGEEKHYWLRWSFLVPTGLVSCSPEHSSFTQCGHFAWAFQAFYSLIINIVDIVQFFLNFFLLFSKCLSLINFRCPPSICVWGAGFLFVSRSFIMVFHSHLGIFGCWSACGFSTPSGNLDDLMGAILAKLKARNLHCHFTEISEYAFHIALM